MSTRPGTTLAELGVVPHFDLHEIKRHRLGPGDRARPRRVRARQRPRRQVRC